MRSSQARIHLANAGDRGKTEVEVSFVTEDKSTRVVLGGPDLGPSTQFVVCCVGF